MKNIIQYILPIYQEDTAHPVWALQAIRSVLPEYWEVNQNFSIAMEWVQNFNKNHPNFHVESFDVRIENDCILGALDGEISDCFFLTLYYTPREEVNFYSLQPLVQAIKDLSQAQYNLMFYKLSQKITVG